MKKGIGIVGMALALAVGAQAQVIVTNSIYSSGTNNDGNNAANATVIRVGQQDSGGTVLTFTGYTAFDLNASGLTQDQLMNAQYILDFNLISFRNIGGAPDEITVEYLGTYVNGEHSVANVNGGDQLSGWVVDPAVNTIRSGPIAAGNIVTAPMSLDSTSFVNQYAVFRYSYVPGIVGGSGDSRQWDITDSGANVPQLIIAYTGGENVPPVADDKDVETGFETPVDIVLSGSDFEGSNLTYTVETQPSSGTLTTNGSLPNLIYTPFDEFSGEDSFTYIVNDGSDDSAPATVSITVRDAALGIVPGTVIGIDFSDAEGTDASWNLVDSYSGSIEAGNLIDTSGALLSDVTFNWNFNDTSGVNNNGSEHNTEFPGQPDFPDNVGGDWLGFNNTGSIDLVFSNLNDALTYELTIGAANDIANDNADTGWAVNGGTAQSTVASNAALAYVTFSNLTADASGRLVIDGVGTGNAQYGFASALTLTATGTIAPDTPTISASVSDGTVVISWESGGTFDVLTNANLVYPNWGVLESGATSPTTNAISSEAVLFYKLEYSE